MLHHLLSLQWPVQPSQLAIIIPAVTAVVMLVLVRRENGAVFTMAWMSGAVGLFVSAVLLAQQLAGTNLPDIPTVGKLPLGDNFSATLRLHIDSYTVLLLVAVAFVSLVVQLFARWYLFRDPRYRQFAATVALFTAAMQTVVLSGDVLITIVGWELMGWCSYLLIGHDSEREKARRAAYKAFLVTRLADAPFVIGLVALMVGARSTSIADVVEHWSQGGHYSTLAAALICVICGVAGKSAQMPFHDWLPDAMEGPTPASALIHAATMVAAGTVVLARFYPLLERSYPARFVLVVVAGSSAVYAGVLAFLQHDLKRLLAWSTVSQVAIMLIALAVLPKGGTPDLAILHLLGHAMFKALLFLMFGWLSVLAGGTVTQRLSGVVSRHAMTSRLVGIGLLALAAVPPSIGFVSKDLVVDEAAQAAVHGDRVGQIAFIALAVVVFLTAAYCMRAWMIFTHRTIIERRTVHRIIEDSHTVRDVSLMEILSTTAQVDEHGREIHPEPDPAPEPSDEATPMPGRGARIGLNLLALGAIGGGALIFSPLMRVSWQHGNLYLIAASLTLMLAAGLLVRALALNTTYGDPLERLPVSLSAAAGRGFGVDRLYVAFVAPVGALATAVARLDGRLDRGVMALPRLAQAVASRSDRVHTRKPTTGLVAIAVGLLIVGLLGVALW